MKLLDVVELINSLRLLEKKVTVTLMYSGLSVTQFNILTIIDSSDSMTVSELSKRLHVTRASTSALVNELVNSGTLTTSENPNDRRSFYLQLSRRGKEKLEVARKDLSVMQTNLSANYTEEDILLINKFSAGMRWEHIHGI